MTPAEPRVRPFLQVDVFTDRALLGNPLAVVDEADDLDPARMQAIARWTNLSETVFLSRPTDPAADYRVRIFTPGGELPFAGHPTLGSCHAWLARGGVPRDAGEIVQECGVGLVRIRRRAGGRLAFAAPPLRIETVDPALLEAVTAALGLDGGRIVAAAWLDNGPRWLGLQLDAAETVRGLAPDEAALKPWAGVAVIGPQAPGGDTDFEVRFFAPSLGVSEDPVTGSANASLAEWLIGRGAAPSSYVAAQGTCIGRAGRVHIEHDGSSLWVGGDSVEVVRGTVTV